MAVTLTLEEYLYTLPCSLTGQPVVVLPFGESEDRLPIGVQLIARWWCDHVAIAAGIALERSAARSRYRAPAL